MAYITQSELEARMYDVRLADCCDDTTSGTADAEIVETLIEDASGVADGYLQTAGYTVPRATATVALKHHVAWIAAHFAASRRQQYRDQRGVAPYRQEYTDALAWLQRVADRKTLLEGQDPEGLASANADSGGGGGMVLHAYRGQQAPPRGATRMRGW